jgi:large subunit ribosomal protein L6
MSRIGKKPIVVPAGVDININGTVVTVKGPKGQLSHTLRPEVSLAQNGNELVVERQSDAPSANAMHGTTRAVLNNMVQGVKNGWSKVIQIEGVGYRAEMQGKNLVMNLGFSHPVIVEPPAGIEFEVDAKVRTITIKGPNREQVGQVASEVRSWRPPEPYKGKGLRYSGEFVRRKAGKAGKSKK